MIPFLATFLVVLFVLVMQMLWLQFDKIAGRGLGPAVIFKFLGYTALGVLPTALSIGILLSSIMALGNLSENYEFAAIKAAGISLNRMLKPMIIFMIILSGLNFLFLNYVFPFATYESRNLTRNMQKKQPALALIAGSFNTDLPGFSIKFDEKYGEKNNKLKNVLIYDLRDNRYNNKVITAKRGEILTNGNSKFMTLVLYDGYYYQDVYKRKEITLNKDNMPFISAHFEEHKINIDISSLNKFDEKNKYDQHFEMLSLKQLQEKVKKEEPRTISFFNKTVKQNYKRIKGNKLLKDTVFNKNVKLNLKENFTDLNYIRVLKNAKREVKQIKNNFKSISNTLKRNKKFINSYKIEFHRRIAFSFACLVLFLVGAPLGSLIRKGGFGIPMIMAIIIFVIYFFVGVMAKGTAESGTISPFLAGWFSTIIMFPFGLLLLYKAGKDKGLFSLETFFKPILGFFKDKILRKNGKNEN